MAVESVVVGAVVVGAVVVGAVVVGAVVVGVVVVGVVAAVLAGALVLGAVVVGVVVGFAVVVAAALGIAVLAALPDAEAPPADPPEVLPLVVFAEPEVDLVVVAVVDFGVTVGKAPVAFGVLGSAFEFEAGLVVEVVLDGAVLGVAVLAPLTFSEDELSGTSE